ncbi:hypothetical protein SAMN05660462_02887 [Proteiniborus ethanoligenes]|uniref:Uncharacterized protein n=2 Tax=Proteiniborus ethanoligenes TaxID=415015 RepID=A0A1H3SIK7_9FIRM|nr:hypothetical protein SAMN05660462_02887 [Proteiniborus ethanoligenes]
MKIVLIILVFIIIAAGCTADNTNLEEELKKKEEEISILKDKNKALEDKISSLESEVGVENTNSLLIKVIEVIELIKDKDMKNLSSYVHPEKGLRFTPYPYIDLQNDQVFKAQSVAELLQDTKVYTWGSYDGSGEPIELKFNDYYDKFIYDADFANPHMIGNNVTIGTGNTIDNVDEAYPNGYFVELYFKGFEPQYEGIDWRSLKLVFEELNGAWYLVSIVHGQWTI